MSRLLKSSGAVGGATLLSRVLGFGRELVYAAFMGDGVVASAFFFAFTIPNLFRRLLGEGALTAAFVPIAKEREQEGGDAALWRATNAVLWGLVLVSVGLVVLIMAALTGVLAIGGWSVETELVLRLLRVMFPYVGCVCVAALFMGVLNARGHFFLPALGPLLLNVVLIASVYLLAPWFGADRAEQVFGLAVGVLVAGVFQAVFQWPVLRREGYRVAWVNPFREPVVRQVVTRMAPAVMGVAAYQINVVVTQSLAYFESPEAVASFNYAVRLMELPQGVVGISLATFLLAELSGLAADRNYPQFRSVLTEGLLQVLFINTLAMVLLVVLAEPMIRFLFERNAFTPASTARATFALQCLAPGLLAFSVNNLLARAFYALGDTSTPMRISVFCLGANLLFAVFLIPAFQQGGMGMANSLSGFLNTGLLVYAFRRKQPRFDLSIWWPQVRALTGLGAVAALCAWGAFRGCDHLMGHATFITRMLAVLLPVAVGVCVYATGATLLGLPQWRSIAGLVRRVK